MPAPASRPGRRTEQEVTPRGFAQTALTGSGGAISEEGGPKSGPVPTKSAPPKTVREWLDGCPIALPPSLRERIERLLGG